MKRDREATCYNPHDPMSKRIYGVVGAYRCLDAGNSVGGQSHGVLVFVKGTDFEAVKTERRNDECV